MRIPILLVLSLLVGQDEPMRTPTASDAPGSRPSLKDYAIWTGPLLSGKSLKVETLEFEMARRPLTGDLDVRNVQSRFRKNMSIEAASIWAIDGTFFKSETWQRMRAGMEKAGLKDDSESTVGLLGVSGNRTYAMCGWFREITAEDCIYVTDYFLVRLRDCTVVGHRQICASLPDKYFSGFVRSQKTLAYVIEGNEDRRVLSIRADEAWVRVGEFAPWVISASPVGDKIVLVHQEDNAKLVEMRDADLQSVLWLHRITQNYSRPASPQVVWSTDAQIVALELLPTPGQAQTVIFLDSRDGSVLHRFVGGNSKHPILRKQCVILPVSRETDLSELLGIELVRSKDR